MTKIAASTTCLPSTSAIGKALAHDMRSTEAGWRGLGARVALAVAIVGFCGCGVAQATAAVQIGQPRPTQIASHAARSDLAAASSAAATHAADDHSVATAAAMGGPFNPAGGSEAVSDIRADQQVRTLFQTWKKLDTFQTGGIAIPSVHPVDRLQFTSNFGIRTDPFRGTAAMHAGVDIPGPIGTPIYATADGTVDHAERTGGYGNMVEIDHGKGIATRYGHLSKILVEPGTHVTRGQLIALMGSTGRSTGSHLHYEVRIDGHAVNPAPFLTTADYLVAVQDHAVAAIPVNAGPAPQD